MTLWNRYHYQNSWCDSHLIENRILIKKYYGFSNSYFMKKRFKLSLPSPSLDWPLKNHLIILLSHHLYLHLICWAKAFLTLHPKPQTIKTGYLFHLCQRSTLIVDFTKNIRNFLNSWDNKVLSLPLSESKSQNWSKWLQGIKFFLNGTWWFKKKKKKDWESTQKGKKWLTKGQIQGNCGFLFVSLFSEWQFGADEEDAGTLLYNQSPPMVIDFSKITQQLSCYRVSTSFNLEGHQR